MLLFLRVAAHQITSFEFDGREMGVLKIHSLRI